MSFDQSTIQDVIVAPFGADLRVSWIADSPPGTLFQCYVDRQLSWQGTALQTLLPFPSKKVRIEVGTIAPADAGVDFSASLPTPPGGGQRITLTWQGGTYLGALIVGYHVYLGDAPGGAVDYSSPVETVAAYTGHVVTDGFGIGPFGAGGFGHAAATYTWISEPLSVGTWNVGIKPFDTAGNEGTAVTSSVALSGPPRSPTPMSNGRRLAYTWNAGTSGPIGFGMGPFGAGPFGGPFTGFGGGGFGLGGFGSGGARTDPTVTLNWLASPGF